MGDGDCWHITYLPFAAVRVAKLRLRSHLEFTDSGVKREVSERSSQICHPQAVSRVVDGDIPELKLEFMVEIDY